MLTGTKQEIMIEFTQRINEIDESVNNGDITITEAFGTIYRLCKTFKERYEQKTKLK
jgi:hypothetical protein